MSNGNSHSTQSNRAANKTADLAADVQAVQDGIEDAEDDIPTEALETLDTFEDRVETLEDALDDTDGDLPDNFSEQVQSAQDALETLQDQLFEADNIERDLLTRVDDLEDAVEAIEDETENLPDDGGDGAVTYTVQIAGETAEFERATVSASAIIELAENNPSEFILEALTDEHGTAEDEFSHNEEVDLSEPNRYYFRVMAAGGGNSAA